MNHFLMDFYSRLQSWRDLREHLQDKNSAIKAERIDAFWQKVPTVNYYLHPDYISQWPDPWQLIHDNNYCPYARALGIIYTFLLLGTRNLALVDAKDHNSNEVVLVLFDNAKYVMNYWPGTVLNNRLADFSIIKEHDIAPLEIKIGKI